MLEARIHSSIAAIAPDPWNACFPDSAEDHACLAAIEAAGIDGFLWRYLTIEDKGAIVAAAAAFVTDYPLDTTLTGPARRALARARTIFPRLLTPRLACIGSPCTEIAPIGFPRDVGNATRREAAKLLTTAFGQVAAQEQCMLLGYKDIGEDDARLWSVLLAAQGFQPTPGLPIAWLPIHFESTEEYISSLSSGTRRDMRRKLRAAAGIRVEHRASIDDVIDRVMALYHETHARAEMRFENLTAGYFTGMLKHMAGRAFCMLYWDRDDLLAFNLLIEHHGLLLDKFFCMDGIRGRAFNLYFLSWFTNLRYCLDHGLSKYQAGQAAYVDKLRLGSRLAETRVYFRHRNAVCNRALRLISPLLAIPAISEAA